MPPEPRQGSRADPQAEGSALGPPGPSLWEGTDSQQPHPRMKPSPLTPCPPGVPSPSPPPHKLELQTLKLEELTVSELRQQLRLRGLPVSGTKSMLLERMRGGAPPRERPKPRREDSPAGAPWPRLKPKALAAARRQGSVKPSAASHRPPLPRAADTPGTAPAPTPTPAPAAAPALTPSSAPGSAALTLEEELQEAIRRAQTPCPLFPWTSLAPSTCCPPPRTLKASHLFSPLHSRLPRTPPPLLPGTPRTPWTGWRP
ncbi:MEF2-activating motif and SAP domain-containing transcriptional regulator isoform X2 [Pan paniscus]|uniref:MEF2-activating motif and SAP domain-containing transcriptional regulator isoform X2 n=1 Tax=Pan paniscus TaxID=9597 RepID=UPI0030079189